MDIRVGHDTYKIVYKDIAEWGICFTDKKEIWIKKSATKRQKVLTKLHEAIHAVVAAYGIDHTLPDEMEEIYVRVLEVGIAKMIIDNKQFSKELLEELTK